MGTNSNAQSGVPSAWDPRIQNSRPRRLLQGPGGPQRIPSISSDICRAILFLLSDRTVRLVLSAPTSATRRRLSGRLWLESNVIPHSWDRRPRRLEVSSISEKYSRNSIVNAPRLVGPHQNSDPRNGQFFFAAASLWSEPRKMSLGTGVER